MAEITYSEAFHKGHLKNSFNSAKEVVPLFLNYFKPKSVLDVGCGLGTWLTVFESHNCDVFGVDGPYVNTDSLLIDREKYTSHDLNTPLDLGRKFDLTISLEVAEHLYPENAELFVGNLCRHSDIILFSAAIKGQGGTFHYNEQSNNYWVDLFRSNNYHCVDVLRHELWDNTKVSWWYRQNMLIFINSSRIEDPLYRGVVERQQDGVNTYVHPELLEIKSKRIDSLEHILSHPLRVLKYYVGRITSRLK